MSTKIVWRKVGGGSFRMSNGRIIKPNEVFEALLEDIPAKFRDVVVPVDREVFEKSQIMEVKQEVYVVRHRGAGWYDVLNSQGKVISEKALREEEAKNLVNRLVG